MRYAMIMAGGVGTRLWPVSRAETPKQLVPLIERPGGTGREALLTLASSRLGGLVDEDKRYICTNESYRGLIKRHVPGFTDERILGEPVGRDTVNAVGFAAAVLHKRDPEAVFAVLTADHIIRPDETFRSIIDVGFRLVEQDPTRLVTFSITPTYAATGFGYIERGDPLPNSDGLGYRVERFVEKPSAEKAQAYLEAGAFGWNAGMFVWKASTILDCLRRYKPESYEGLMTIAQAWGTDDQRRVLDDVYPRLPKISVDYAIMEPAAREHLRARGTEHEKSSVKVCTVEMDLEWLDVGSWPSYGETLQPLDESGTRVSGRAIAHECTETLVVNTDDTHTVTVLGAEDLIVVHTREATLVMPRDRAQDLKTLHAKLPDALK
ncbi:MAG: mannose-1-phosphate guanylyltransferase [Phycisphaerales bacterium]